MTNSTTSPTRTAVQINVATALQRKESLWLRLLGEDIGLKSTSYPTTAELGELLGTKSAKEQSVTRFNTDGELET